MNESRPDPDELLARLQQEEARQAHGHLKIFFGMAAGVGKTYAMLLAAHERIAEGVDVVIGWVETHKRAETEALLAGLERLAPCAIDYRGTTLHEFDLDAALKRRPQLILMDELAQDVYKRQLCGHAARNCADCRRTDLYSSASAWAAC